MARYRLTGQQWFPDLGIVEPGEEIEWDGPPSRVMEPVEKGKESRGPVKVIRAKRVVHDPEEEAMRFRGPGRSKPHELPPTPEDARGRAEQQQMLQPQAGDDKLSDEERRAAEQQRGPSRSVRG